MTTNVLQVSDCSKSFGGVKALVDVNLDVPTGSIKAIIGPNGAGKTTLFNCITGFYALDRGRCLLDNEDITNLPVHRITGRGMVRTFQNVRLFGSMTVFENVMVGRHTRSKSGLLAAAFRLPSMRREEKRILAATMEVLEFIGLADLATQQADSLPFGRQRLLELGRALAAQPKVILFDEPAAGLNPRETIQLAKLLGRVRDRGITLVLVEHDMDLVMDISDEIIVLNYGQKIAEGTPTEIQSNEEVILAYLGEEE
jgi:branched-chain amino acid transport system ATP-binding protein